MKLPKVKPNRYHNTIDLLRVRSQRMKDNLSIHTPEFYRGSYCHLSKDGTTGYAIHSDTREVFNVFSTSKNGEAVLDALKYIPNLKLKCLDGSPVVFFSRAGFVVRHRLVNEEAGGADYIEMCKSV